MAGADPRPQWGWVLGWKEVEGCVSEPSLSQAALLHSVICSYALIHRTFFLTQGYSSLIFREEGEGGEREKH